MSIRSKTLHAILGVAVVAMLASAPRAYAQPAITAPSSVLPTGGGQALIDTSDSVLLLLDHQSGLFQTVKDIGVTELRNNTIMLAKLATLLKIPVITTASEPDGPNGPLMPEIHQFAPHAVYVGRKGEVNAWDNEDFVKAVRATGKKTLIMAGVWTSVCVMFPALDAKAAGFKVYAVIDASGIPASWHREPRSRASSKPAWFRPRRTQCCRRRIAPGIDPKPPNLRNSMPLWPQTTAPLSRAIKRRRMWPSSRGKPSPQGAGA